MTDAQTEARAIARWTRDAAGWVEWPDGEWVRYSDHTTALEAQAAELAAVKEMYAREGAKALYELERAERAEAQLAEANKALEPLWMLADAVFRDGMNSGKPDDAGVWGFDNATLTYGHLRTARRIREQGGENG